MRKILSTLVVAAVAVTGIVIGVNQADAAPLTPSGIKTPVSSGAVWQTGFKGQTVNYGADGSWSLRNMHWKTWNTKTAIGTGTLHINNCVLDCANSTSFTDIKILANASQVKQNKFTRLIVTVK